MEKFTEEDVAEEIEMSLGLKSVKMGNEIFVDTFVGLIKIVTFGQKTLMSCYYRFLGAYGGKMQAYGLRHKLEEESK